MTYNTTSAMRDLLPIAAVPGAAMVREGMAENYGAPAPTLRDWLADWSDAERAALARLWSLPVAEAGSSESLADTMLRREVVERMLVSLSPIDRLGLERVQEHGGSIAAARMEREFGPFRVQPAYRNPRAFLQALPSGTTTTERLFLLGLLRPLETGPRRRFAIPTDVLAALPQVAGRAGVLTLTPAAAPPDVAMGLPEAIERDLLELLVIAQSGQIQVGSAGALNRGGLARLARHVRPAGVGQEPPGEEDVRYLRLLFQLGRGAALLQIASDGRARPSRTAIAWLRAPRIDRLRRLLEGWFESDWDELAELAQLSFRRPYARDLPAAKRAASALFGQLPPGAWVDLDELTAEIRRAAPDYARPDGRYDTWGILDHGRLPLDGFAFWDAVEGRQLRAIGCFTLRRLGLVDIGLRDGRPTSVRLTPYGAALLGEGSAPGEPSPDRLIVQPSFEVVAPPGASLYAIFQLGRVAERTGGPAATTYRLTRRSVQAAMARGVSVEDVLRFLEEQSGRPAPQNVAATLRDWAAQHGHVSLRRAVLLETRDAALLQQIRRDRRVRLPQVEPLTETAWRVRPGDAAGLAERLRRAGYGLTEDEATDPSPLRERDLTALFAALEFYAQACASLGVESGVSDAMRRRVSRLLAEPQLNRAYRAARSALQALDERLREGSD